MKPNDELDWEELCRQRPWYRDLLKNMPPITRKPKSKLAVLAPVSDKLGAAVKANPESLRLSAKADDGTTIIERPDQRRPLSRVEVIEVDANGRPLLVQTYDPTTNTAGLVKYEQGYERVGAKHEYNPLDALKWRNNE